jgi:hypothetical protein
MLIPQLALVSETSEISAPELTRVSAALQKQALRDFGPIWRRRPTVDAFMRLEDVPLGYWPIWVRDDINVPGAAGIHLDKDGQPFSLVQFETAWSLTASHEALEMIADPFGNRVTAGPSLKDDQGRVEYLVEVCDPSEDVQFSYTVNDITVSDFYTPRYFDPTPEGVPGVRYSFTGAITKPRQVLPGGYVSWHEPVSDHWWQLTMFGQPEFVDLGVLGRIEESLRTEIDKRTPQPLERVSELTRENDHLSLAIRRMERSEQASSTKAAGWRAQVEELLSG